MSNQEEVGEEEEFGLNENDIVKVIPLDDDDARPETDSDDEEAEDDEMETDEGAVSSITPDVDNAKFVFSGHKDSVFCVRMNPSSSSMAVSGGQDDRAVVWDIKTGEIILECTGHKDSVTSVGWSHDGVYLATADLAGVIKVWKMETKEEIWSFETGDVEWLEWHHGAHVLVVGTVDGEVWMWKIPGGDCKTFLSHGPGAVCGAILNDGKRACVGYEDGVVKVWDLKSGNSQHTFSGHEGHLSSVICLHAHPDSSLVITGSTDTTAKLYNTSAGKVISTLDCSSHKLRSEDQNSVETVGLSSVVNYAATGTLGGVLSIWDIPTSSVRHQCKHEAGIVKLRWDRTTPLLCTVSLDGVVRLWDSRSGKEESQWTGHTASILDFDVARDREHLVSVSEDHTARVYSLVSPDG